MKSLYFPLLAELEIFELEQPGSLLGSVNAFKLARDGERKWNLLHFYSLWYF